MDDAKDDGRTHLKLKVTGYVQSVGYRNFVMAEARKLSIDGWVRNRFDGSVEILVSGPDKEVELFVGICMRGPPSARVENVEMRPVEPPQEKGFKRRPSY